MAAPRSSVAVTVTRAALTLAAAVALTRVFAGRSWLFVMVLAAVAPPAYLVWTERQHWPALLRFAVVGLGGVWLAALVADPSTAVVGVPTRATIASLGRALGDAPHTLRSAVVPVTPVESALVLAFVSVFAAAALAHWIATSLDAPIGAFAPSVALFIVVAAVGSGGWVLPTALYACASLAYLLSLAQHDLVARRTWFHATAPRASRLAAGGALLGAIAIVAALVAGPSVPGASGSAWLDFKQIGNGSGEASLLSAPPPILSIRDKLTLGPVQEIFSVKAPRPAYWRVIALDWFSDENAWGINKAAEQSASKLTAPDDLPPSEAMHEQFHIDDLDPHWLPAAYRPVATNLEAARVVPDSLTLLVDSKAELSDLVYDVDSEIPTPSPQQLERAPQADRGQFARDLELPADLSQPVRDLAEEITARATTPYEKAIALLHFFRDGNFKYNLHTNLGDSPDAIAEFLLHTREGFCEQFAASYAALARVVGLPARVAVGYQPGTLGSDGKWHVTNRNAHAWPEVYFVGAGWIPFEPTPAFTEPTLGLGTGGPRKSTPGPASTTTTTSSVSTSTIVPPSISLPAGGSLNVQTPTPPASHHRMNRALTGFLLVVGALLLGALAFAAFASYTLWRRSWRRRHDEDPRRRVLGAWSEALDHLVTAGVPRRPSATALEFALRYAPAHGAGAAGGPALMELARLESAAMYAEDPPTPDDATYAWEQADTIRETIRRTIARPTRWRRRIRQIRED